MSGATLAEQGIAYANDPLMAAAWYSALTWAAGSKDVLAAYRQETGNVLSLALPRSPIERMVDQATGFQEDSVNRFVEWFNRTVWGDDPFTEEDPAARAARLQRELEEFEASDDAL